MLALAFAGRWAIITMTTAASAEYGLTSEAAVSRSAAALDIYPCLIRVHCPAGRDFSQSKGDDHATTNPSAGSSAVGGDPAGGTDGPPDRCQPRSGGEGPGRGRTAPAS